MLPLQELARCISGREINSETLIGLLKSRVGFDTILFHPRPQVCIPPPFPQYQTQTESNNSQGFQLLPPHEGLKLRKPSIGAPTANVFLYMLTFFFSGLYQMYSRIYFGLKHSVMLCRTGSHSSSLWIRYSMLAVPLQHLRNLDCVSWPTSFLDARRLLDLNLATQ